jgi:hypothetical protein
MYYIQAYSATGHEYSKPLPLYFRPIPFDPPQLTDQKPSPFFKQDDQLFEDNEDGQIYEDEDDMINMMKGNKGPSYIARYSYGGRPFYCTATTWKGRGVQH